MLCILRKKLKEIQSGIKFDMIMLILGRQKCDDQLFLNLGKTLIILQHCYVKYDTKAFQL